MQRQFWWLQIIGWFTYTIVVFITVVSPFMIEGREYQQIFHLMVEILVGFSTTMLMWFIVNRLNAAKTSYLISACVVLALVLSCVFNVAKLISHKILVNGEGWNTWTWQDFGI